MSTYKVVSGVDEWDFENGFYLTCENSRLSDFIAHCEIYKMILGIPGDIVECGVYKGSSLIQFLCFREYFENAESRKVFGFDVFGKFPNELELDSDRSFVQRFESEGGYGISKDDLESYLSKKGLRNFQLIKGDVIETLPQFIERNPERRFSLVHVDVDVYEPTVCILENLWDRLVRGGLLVFDDFGTVEGETRAVDEFLDKTSVRLKKLPYKHKPSFLIKP